MLNTFNMNLKDLYVSPKLISCAYDSPGNLEEMLVLSLANFCHLQHISYTTIHISGKTLKNDIVSQEMYKK